MSGNDTFTNILLHFDGTNGSTTITDDCAGVAAHTWTNHTGSISTSQSQFGGASYNCGSTGYVDTPDSADFDVGSGDFTAEIWFNRQGGDGARRIMFGQAGSTGAIGTISYYVELSAANVVHAVVSTGASQTGVTGTTAITTTGWHHVAFVRTGNTLKLFLDGTQEGGDVAFSSTVNNSTQVFAVGRGGAFTTLTWNGYLDEFRLSVGVARWTANFTPPSAAYDASVILSASPGSFSESGIAALFAAKQSVSTGSFAEIGQAATFAAKVPVAIGSFTETGNAVALAVRFPGAAASYSITGNVAFFKPAVVASSGTIALTMGSAVTLLDFTAANAEYVIAGATAGGVFGIPSEPTAFLITTFPAQFSTTMELWTNQSSGSESWTAQSGGSEIWTPQTGGSETWH